MYIYIYYIYIYVYNYYICRSRGLRTVSRSEGSEGCFLLGEGLSICKCLVDLCVIQCWLYYTCKPVVHRLTYKSI